MRVMGIDPGLQHTGWGVIDVNGNKLTHIAHGVVHTKKGQGTPERLKQIHDDLMQMAQLWQPQEAAIEETFVNKNPASALKLGLARGVAMVVPACLGLPVSEYPANLVKKSVVGSGHADKAQIQTMIGILLPGVQASPDAADALAVAICHTHHRVTREKLGGIMAGGVR